MTNLYFEDIDLEILVAEEIPTQDGAAFHKVPDEASVTADIDASASESNHAPNEAVPTASSVDTLSSWGSVCILINFISMGYVLNPSGKFVKVLLD